MSELKMLANFVGEKNLERGLESVNKENRIELSSKIADGDDSVTEVQVHDMIKEMEDRTIDEIEGELPGLGEPILRMMAQKSLANYLAERVD